MKMKISKINTILILFPNVPALPTPIQNPGCAPIVVRINVQLFPEICELVAPPKAQPSACASLSKLTEKGLVPGGLRPRENPGWRARALANKTKRKWE